MADFHIYRLLRDTLQLQRLDKPRPDWNAVIEFFQGRERSKNEQLVILWNGEIYAVERKDGKGFAMVWQDRQNEEDDFWYPPAE